MQIKTSSQQTNTRGTYLKVMQDSIELNQIGSAIKTRRFPFVIKKLGLKTSLKPTEEPKKNIPILKLQDDTFKTLPSLRNSSYQTYRQPSNILKEYQNKIELSYNKIIWGPETVIASSNFFEPKKPKRTQILYAEKLFSPNSDTKREPHSAISPQSPSKFEEIYEKIKTRSEKKAAEIVSLRSTF